MCRNPQKFEGNSRIILLISPSRDGLIKLVCGVKLRNIRFVSEQSYLYKHMYTQAHIVTNTHTHTPAQVHTHTMLMIMMIDIQRKNQL